MKRVEVRTNSRLHFGLTSLGHDRDRPQFGGVGLMVDAPRIHLQLSPAEHFFATGPLSERAEIFATRIAKRLQLPELPELHINIDDAPPEHTGLGVGTQLGLAVAAGIAETLGLPWRDPVRLAQLTGRGRRSAVGTYGFLLGGMIVDNGHRLNEPLGDLKSRVEIPTDWRFVLITPCGGAGRSGSAEERSFSELMAMPAAVTTEMNELIDHQLLPAAQSASFNEFSAILYRYGCLAGKCFAPAQGGTFSSPQAAKLIAWLRDHGVAGVGQSSWGPTVFALCENHESANSLILALRNEYHHALSSVRITAPANVGACVQ